MTAHTNNRTWTKEFSAIHQAIIITTKLHS